MRKLLALFMCSAFVGAVALSAGGCGGGNSVGAGDGGSDANNKPDGSGKPDGNTGDGGTKPDGNSGDGGDGGGCLSFPEFVLNQIKTTKPDSPPVAIPPVCAADSGLIPSSSF
jgi:hypothetical protein